MSDNTFYAYSFDEETFHGQFATPEEALIAVRNEANLENCPMGKAWIGTGTPVRTSDYMLCADDVRNFVAERAGDECGDASEYWLADRFEADTAKKIDDLLDQIAEVIQQTEPPRFFKVTDVVEHLLGNRP